MLRQLGVLCALGALAVGCGGQTHHAAPKPAPVRHLAKRHPHRVTDINPRFGGAFPLPTAAGSRYPELAIALANGERPEPRVGEFREGVVMTRFFSELCLAETDGRLAPFAAEEREPARRP